MRYPFRIKVKARPGHKVQQLKQINRFRSQQCRGDSVVYTEPLRRSQRDRFYDQPAVAFEVCFSDNSDAVMFKLSWNEEILEDG